MYHVYVVVIFFISGKFYFSYVSTLSIHYHTQKQTKNKNYLHDKKLTTTY